MNAVKYNITFEYYDITGRCRGDERRNIMKNRCRTWMRRCGVALAAVACCLMSACQPTPTVEAVPNKNDGRMEQAMVTESAEQGTEQSTQPNPAAEAVYTVSEHWSETTTPVKDVTVKADADVRVPENDGPYPVVKLASGTISQDQVSAMGEYFVGDSAVYQLPAEQTKADIEPVLLDQREELARLQADDSDPETEAIMREMIAELEQQYANAPEQSTAKPADLTYTYQYDYETGEPLEYLGQNYVNVEGKDADGTPFEVYAVRALDADDAWPFFSYYAGGFASEANDLEMLEEIKRAEGHEDDKGVDLEQKARLEERIPRYDAMTMDEAETRRKAEELIHQFGIKDVMISSISRALWGNGVQNPDGSMEYSEPAMLVDFTQSNAGMPVVCQESGFIAAGDTVYSAPFSPASGRILMTQDGKIRWFAWYSPCEIVDTIARDSEPMPFSEAKDTLAKLLARTYADYMEGDGSLEIEISDVELVMSCTNVENEPDRALEVPAWRATARVSANGQTVQPEVQILINALDGSPILPPGYGTDTETQGERA